LIVKPAITKFLAVALGIFWLASAFGAEVIPPKPAKYFNDYAGVVSPNTAAQLNFQLEQFERDAYNQIVVAVFPKMQSDSDAADYCVRVFNAWGVGQKDKRNGAVLFVFIQDRKMRIVTGYGLEGALPDATCKDIIEDVIKPRFKANDFNGGLAAGVNAILAATKGEYHGTGRTVREGERNSGNQPGLAGFIFFLFVFLLIAFAISRSRNSGAFYSNAGWVIGNVLGSMNNRGGGGSSWGGGGGGDSGGFSGGGGSSGGGGAGGSW
jgi:uncharacterized protein